MAALLLLSLLWAGAALRVDLLPELFSGLLPHLERQTIPLALLAIAAGLLAFLRGDKWPSGRRLGCAALIGLGLFAAPAGLVSLSDGWVPGLARTALFTLTPVFAVVFEPYVGEGLKRPVRGGLSASLTALAGALLVFPVAIPSSIAAGIALLSVILAAACVAAANCLGVAESERLTGCSAAGWAAMASVAGASAAIALAAASMFVERAVWRWPRLAPELLWSAAVELPGLLLLFWLMPRMSAPRMATRYLLAPVLVILIGVMLLRSGGEVRGQTWLGLILMAVGMGWLNFAPRSDADLSLNL